MRGAGSIRRAAWRPGFPGGFTLIEMLAVLVIVGLLLGLSSVALVRVAGTEAVRQSATALEATLSLARQHAIAHREETFVVFIPPNLNFTQLSRLKPLAGRCYAVYARNPESGEGRLISEWTRLPTGAILDATSGRPNTPFLGQAATTVPGIRLRRDGVVMGDSNPYTTRDLPGLGFRTTGRPFLLDGYRIYLTEGIHEIDRDTDQLRVEIQTGARVEAVVRVAPLTGIAYTESYEAVGP